MQQNINLRYFILKEINKLLSSDKDFSQRLLNAIQREESEKQSFEDSLDKLQRAIKNSNSIKAHEAYWEAKKIYDKMCEDYVGQKYIDDSYRRLFNASLNLQLIFGIKISHAHKPSFNSNCVFSAHEIFEMYLCYSKVGFTVKNVELDKQIFTDNNISSLSEKCLKRIFLV